MDLARPLGRLAAGVAGALAMLAVFAPPPALADPCTGAEQCGIPACWLPGPLRVRPDMPRVLTVSCMRLTAATVKQQPLHGALSGVSTEEHRLRLTLHADADAPRHDEAVFELSGREGSIELRVPIEVLPLAENRPPTCHGGTATQRSDGTASVQVYVSAGCQDDDGDELVIRGGGPGVHPLSPKQLGAGEHDSYWLYNTATSFGTEVTTIWATDVLGARSAAAQIEVTVGADVDRPSGCRPGPNGWIHDGVQRIYSRAGATRRFAVICRDEDGDPLAARLLSPPQRGRFSLFEPGAYVSGSEQWFDATYVPPDDNPEPDEFSMLAAGPGGDGPVTPMAIVPVEPSRNGGGGCSWGPLMVLPGTSGVVQLECDDTEGDPLSAEIVGEPLHGSAGPPAVNPAPYGLNKITIPYTPASGYEGQDCIKVTVADGRGLTMTMLIDVFVAKPQRLPTGVLPYPQSSAPPPPRQPAGTRAYAAQILGTDAVKRLAAPRGVSLWVPTRLSKRDLLRNGRAPGMLVLCPTGCRISSGSTLNTGSGRRARASERRTSLVASAGKAKLLWLTVQRNQRTALRRARSARATLTAAIRTGTAKARTVRRSIRIGP